ncbi:MAG TPA: hypothetical protein VGJ84_17275 [Polyangiaceae bacterium]|jgi:hypothetical protein
MNQIRIYEVVGGHPVPDVSTLDYDAAVAHQRALERRLAITRGDPAQASHREQLRIEVEAVARRIHDLEGGGQEGQYQAHVGRHR